MEQQQALEEKQVASRDDLTGPLALGTFGVASIADIFIHGGWPGVGAGALAAAFVYFGGTPYIRAARRLPGVSTLLVEHPLPASGSNRSIKDRLFNNFPEEAQPHEEQSCVTPQKAQQLTTAQVAPMEALQPKQYDLDDDLTDEEIESGLAQIMASSRSGDEHIEGGSVQSIIGANPRRRLVMAENFQPDANDPLATGVAAFGIPGSGKTTAVIRFFEQYVEQYHLPFVAFDSQGDWKSLVESGFCPRGVIATPDNLPTMASVVKHGLQVVLDLSEWREQGKIEISYELAAQVIAASIRSLMAAQKVIASHNRIPCLVGLDEAQLWVPEGASGFMSKETQQSIKSAVMALATTGRKLGVVPFVAGPRIAQIDKDAIAGIETRLFGKVDLDNDLKRYRDYIPAREISDQQLRQLGKGDLVVCMSGQRMLSHFYNRATQHTSHTPRVSQSLARFAATLPPETLAQITRAQEPLTETRKFEMPEQETHTEKLSTRNTVTSGVRTVRSAAERKQERDQRLRGMSVASRQDVRVPETPVVEDGPDEELERGIRIYRGGAMTLDKFQVAMGFAKPNQARTLWTRVKMEIQNTHTQQRG